VFSHCTDGNSEHLGQGSGPALFFYDLDKTRETVRILGGEAFIDYFSDPAQPNNGQVIFIGNKEIMSEPMWGEKTKIQKEDAVKYVKAASTERGSAIVIA